MIAPDIPLSAVLRPMLTIGARVRCLDSSGFPLEGVFIDRGTYSDHTPGAVVELDGGAWAFLHLAELTPLGAAS